MTFLDARSGGDPFVGGIHQLFQVMVGHDAGRNAGAESTNIAGMIHEMSEHGRTQAAVVPLRREESPYGPTFREKPRIFRTGTKRPAGAQG